MGAMLFRNVWGKNVLVTSLCGKQRTPTLLKGGQGIVGLHVGLGLVGCDTNGNEILEGGLELVVKLDRLGHGKVVQLMGEHDGTNLATGQQGSAMNNRDGCVQYYRCHY